MRHPKGRAALARGLGQPIVAGITVNLQDAVEAGEDGFGILARAARGVAVDDAGRLLPAPGSIIAGQGPEITGLCHTAPRIEHRGGGFVHEQLGRPFQMLGHPVDDGLQMERGLADPVGQNCAMQFQPRPRQDLALTVQMR